jgi:hypothetical protein
VFSHLDVQTLVEKKMVSRNWRRIGTDVIDAKRTSETKKKFQTNRELKDAVKKYTGRFFHPTTGDGGASPVICDDDDDDHDHHHHINNTVNAEQERHSMNSGHCCNPDEAEEFAKIYECPI